jgi:hypothetical protein
VHPLSYLATVPKGVSLLLTLAGTESSAPRRPIRRRRPRAADWAADPARIGHEPGYTWVEPDATLRCVHCGNQPCRVARTGHHLKSQAAVA